MLIVSLILLWHMFLHLSLSQGCCIGQGSFSELTSAGFDVQSLVSLPESDSDSTIEADDINIEEKEKDLPAKTTAVKSVVGI